MTYLITWSCYGSHVPGDEETVSRRNNLVGARRASEAPALAQASQQAMTDAPWLPTTLERQIILQTIADVCCHRGWALLAAHVRATHVHVVVQAKTKPEAILHAFKSYSSRALNRDDSPCKRWARHGSTVYLWTPDEIAKAVDYVVAGQGEAMALYAAATAEGGTIRR